MIIVNKLEYKGIIFRFKPQTLYSTEIWEIKTVEHFRLTDDTERELKMPIEMPRGLPFSVDTWTPSSNMKRTHFLTHAHKDHAQGIISHASYPIYSTLLTKTLLRQFYPQARAYSFNLNFTTINFRWPLAFSDRIVVRIVFAAWWIDVRRYWGRSISGDWRSGWWFRCHCVWRQSLSRSVLLYSYVCTSYFLNFAFLFNLDTTMKYYFCVPYWWFLHVFYEVWTDL